MCNKRPEVSGWVGGWVGACSCRRGQTSRPLSSCGDGWWSDFSRRASAERATPLLDTPRPAASQPQLHVPLRAAGAPKTPAPLAATRALRRAAAAARAQPLALRATPQLPRAGRGWPRGARAVHAPQPARGESPRARAAVSSCRVPRASRQSVAAVVAAHAQPPMPCASARFRPQRPRATRCSTSTARERARCASTCRRAAACARKRTTFGTPRRTPKPRSAAWSAAAALRHAFRHRRRTRSSPERGGDVKKVSHIHSTTPFPFR